MEAQILLRQLSERFPTLRLAPGFVAEYHRNLGLVSLQQGNVAEAIQTLKDLKTTKFDAETFAVRFACEVKGFDPLRFLDT